VLVPTGTPVDVSAGKATVGATVWVWAVRREGLLIATSITVESAAPVRDEFTAIIEGIQGGVWTVAGRRLSTESAVLSGDPPRVGCQATVSGLRYPDGSLVIESIVVDCGEHVELEGVLDSKSGDRWQVSGTTVIVTGAEITGADPELGRRVEVGGYLQRDGSVLATWVRVLQPTPTPTTVPPPTATPTVALNPTPASPSSQDAGAYSAVPIREDQSDQPMFPVLAGSEFSLPADGTGGSTESALSR